MTTEGDELAVQVSNFAQIIAEGAASLLIINHCWVIDTQAAGMQEY